MLGISATDPASYRWEQVQPDDEDYLPSGRRLLRSVADRLQWARPYRSQATSARCPSGRGFGNREGRVTTGTAQDSRDPFADLPLLISVPRAAQLLGISRAAAYRFASAGDLPTKRLGRRVYVVAARLQEFIESEVTAA
jgi:excisionase family DNA binding protein